MPHLVAMRSAEMPWGTSLPSYLATSCCPNGLAPIIEDPRGTRVMFSTPEATTRSYAPAITPCAAKWMDCWDEPHCRSTVVDGMVSGRPAANHALRPTFSDCSPTWETQPVMLSSICPGSTPVRL